MNPQNVTLGPLAAGSAALLAASQTPTSGTPLTLLGVQPDVARRILVTYGNEGSARTMKVTGTNQTGNPISETLAIPSGGGGTIATQQDYATVTQLLPGGGGFTAAVTVGTNGVASSAWQTVDVRFDGGNIGFLVDATGTISAALEYTYDDPNNPFGNGPAIPRALQVPGGDAITADGDFQLNGSGLAAWRITLNSGTGSVNVVASPGVPAK